MSRLKGIVAIFTLVLPPFGGINICNADGFDSVHCGSDVRKALVGRKMPNETIVVLEERYKDLGLKISGLQRSQTVYPLYPGGFVERSTSFWKTKMSCATC